MDPSPLPRDPMKQTRSRHPSLLALLLLFLTACDGEPPREQEILAGDTVARSLEDTISDTTSLGEIRSFPLPQHVMRSEGIRPPTAKRCGEIGGKPRRSEKSVGPMGGLVLFAERSEGRPIHQLWVMPDPSDRSERTFVLEELGNDSVGVRISTDQAVTSTFRAVLILDGTRCQQLNPGEGIGRIPDGAAAIEEMKPGLVDAGEKHVWGLLEGSLSSYVIAVP